MNSVNYPTNSSNVTMPPPGTTSTLFKRFYTVRFEDIDRRDVNPYEILEEINKITGENAVSLTGSNKSSLTLQVKSTTQANKCLEISSLMQNPCTITPHNKFNQSKGLIFVKEFDIEDVEEFKTELQRSYNIIEIEAANFIKTRNSSQAFIITFGSEAPPYEIYIPGERSDTLVAPYHQRPMMCRNCQEYAHTAKWCSGDARCKRCAQEGHTHQECQAELPCCYHCQETHEAGSKECPKWQKEQKIIETVENKKVTFQRARQIVENDAQVSVIRGPKFNSFFDCILPSEEQKRKLKPWVLEKHIEQHIGSKPRSIRTKNSSTFTVEIGTQAESRAMYTLSSIGGIPTKVTVNSDSNLTKGLIYVHGYSMLNFNKYKEGLQKQYGLANVEEAPWIKPRRNSSGKPLIISFRSDPPEYLNIPGEMCLTKVYEYVRTPMQCANCLEYGHPKRICQDTQRCPNCAESHEVEPTNVCTKDPSCFHCGLGHKTGNKQCIEYRFEKEVLAIQSKSRVSKAQARIILNQENPNFRTMNFAETVKSNLPEPSSSKKNQLQKSATSSSQNNQSQKPSTSTSRDQIPKPSTDTPKSNQSKKSQENQLPKPPTNTKNNQIKKTPTNTTDVLQEDELTSRNNPEKYFEVKKIFNEYQPEIENDDRNEYEKELRNTQKRKIENDNTEPRTESKTRKRDSKAQKEKHETSRERRSRSRERDRQKERSRSRDQGKGERKSR